MDLYRQLNGMKQRIPLGPSACNLLPCLHPSFQLLLWEEEASDLKMAFSSHLQQTGLEVWSGGGSDFALDETIHIPLIAPFLLQGQLVFSFSSSLRFRYFDIKVGDVIFRNLSAWCRCLNNSI